MSRPFQLPWEKDYVEPEWIGRLETEQHLLSAEDRSDLGAFDNG